MLAGIEAYEVDTRLSDQGQTPIESHGDDHGQKVVASHQDLEPEPGVVVGFVVAELCRLGDALLAHLGDEILELGESLDLGPSEGGVGHLGAVVAADPHP